MDGYDETTYGERIAAHYDRLDQHADAAVGGPETTAAFLASLTDHGPALELAIGTGRIALPLRARGVEVVGIDISPSMVDEMRAKDGGSGIVVHQGDFAAVDVDGTFPLVYLVFNTLFALTSAEAQQRCFTNVARHLDPGGVFVVEAFVPDLGRFVGDQTLRVRSIDVDQVFLEASLHHPETQMVEGQHVVIRADGVQLFPIAIRYAWPSQIDEMASAAGLRLRDRYADWHGNPFTDDCGFHISVYQRPT